MTTWAERAAMRLDVLELQGRRRFIRDIDGRGPVGKLDDGRTVVSFASNDYLGLSTHPAVLGAAREAIDTWGAGAGGARLISGARPVHRLLEDELADWKGSERALLFPSGYAANLGVITTLADDPSITILSDRLNHASIIDACRLARGTVEVYPHLDIDAVEGALENTLSAICVTDVVFSMDGDLAPVDELARICARRSALLVTDEAHMVFETTATSSAERVRIGTLSKYLGSAGGFVAASEEIIDLLINAARPFIFTTAGAPADAAAALAALRIYRSDEGRELRARLRSNIDQIVPAHASPIVPVVIGEEIAALSASDALLERGYFVPAIRPPSVAPGASRLRVTLSAAHTPDQVGGLAEALESIGVLDRA